MDYRKISSLKTEDDFTAYLKTKNISLPFDRVVRSSPDSPLAQPISLDKELIGNRFCLLPMEGWDAEPDGSPTEITKRRWERLGLSGAKLIWGEAVAVRIDGRDSSSQLMWSDATVDKIAALREHLVQTHKKHFDRTDDLMVGIQLTHSGRVSRLDWDHAAPLILYHHPVLDKNYGLTDSSPVMTDDDISQLAGDFVNAAVLARQAGFDFVDVKHCHGYFGHELLSAVDRPGRYGGSLENRTRFLQEVVSGIRSAAPDLTIAVRLSAFDFIPFERGEDGVGVPAHFEGTGYPYAFGGDGTGTGIDLTEPIAFLKTIEKLGIKLVSISAGGAYNDHILHPASSPFYSYEYLAPEDPLEGVSRLISITAELKKHVPDLIYIGAGYSYLQQWLPNVAQAAVGSGMVDLPGLGRMTLAYPDLPADVLSGRTLNPKKICRTCGLCALAPNNCMISGCYSLDDFYHKHPEYKELRQAEKDIINQSKPQSDGVARRL